jgi:hypothetical protein
MKTSELTGAALDWAVAKCEIYPMGIWYDEDELPMVREDETSEYKPSTNWTQGGAIIEREMIELVPVSGALWEAYKRNQHIPNDGTTPLEAAMRCYVASKLGDEIEVPEELLDFAHE